MVPPRVLSRNSKTFPVFFRRITLWPILLVGLILFQPFVLDAASNDQNTVSEVRVIQLKSGKVVRGKIVFEGNSYYRIAMKEGREKVIFKDQITSMSVDHTASPSPAQAGPGTKNETPEVASGSRPKSLGDALKKSLETAFSSAREEEGKTSVERWKQFVEQIQSFNQLHAGAGIALIVFSVAVWLFFVFVGLAIQAVVLQLSLRLVGASSGFWHAVWFLIKQWLVSVFLSVLFWLGTVVLIFLMSAAPPISTLAIFATYGVVAFIISVAVMVRMYKYNFVLGTGQALLTMLCQTVIWLLISVGLALIYYMVLLSGLMGKSVGGLNAP